MATEKIGDVIKEILGMRIVSHMSVADCQVRIIIRLPRRWQTSKRKQPAEGVERG